MEVLKCSKCREDKKYIEFYKNSGRKSGYNAQCIVCLEGSKKEYQHTINGVISLIFDSQVRSSKKRLHTLPSYTKKELLEYSKNDIRFMSIFSEWKESGHSTDLKPSWDRVDDSAGYSFSNISACTFIDNRNKQYSYAGNKGKRRAWKISVATIDTDGNILNRFDSINSAMIYAGLSNGSDITNSIKRNGTAGGYKWKEL